MLILTLPLRRRLQIFNAVIPPQLMYGLSSAWLTVAEKRRLDGFQARCLRKVLRIAPPFISRVSNKTVLNKANEKPFSSSLLKQQLILYGKVARTPDLRAWLAAALNREVCVQGRLPETRMGSYVNERVLEIRW